jgi:hypothetical protein
VRHAIHVTLEDGQIRGACPLDCPDNLETWECSVYDFELEGFDSSEISLISGDERRLATQCDRRDGDVGGTSSWTPQSPKLVGSVLGERFGEGNDPLGTENVASHCDLFGRPRRTAEFVPGDRRNFEIGIALHDLQKALALLASGRKRVDEKIRIEVVSHVAAQKNSSSLFKRRTSASASPPSNSLTRRCAATTRF